MIVVLLIGCLVHNVTFISDRRNRIAPMVWFCESSVITKTT